MQGIQLGELRKHIVLCRQKRGPLFAIELVDGHRVCHVFRNFQRACGLIGPLGVGRGDEPQRGHCLIEICARDARVQRFIGHLQRRGRISRQQVRSHQAQPGKSAPLAPGGDVGLIGDCQGLLEGGAGLAGLAVREECRPARGDQVHLCTGIGCVRTSCAQTPRGIGRLALELQCLV